MNKRYLIVGLLVIFFIVAQSEAKDKTASFKTKYDSKEKTAVLRLNFKLPEYELREKDGWTEILCEAKNAVKIIEEDNPELPYLNFVISIPADSQIKSVTTNEKKNIKRLTYPIKPAPQPAPLLAGFKPKPLTMKRDIYQSGKEFPSESVTYSIGKMGSATLLNLHIYPFKYIGQDTELVVYDYDEVKIVLKVNQWQPRIKAKNAVDETVKGIIINPDECFFDR